MKTVRPRKGESRKDYLLRCVVAYFEANPIAQEYTIVYDEAECDGSSLIEDIKIELEANP